MISGGGFPGNAEELATGLANAQSWISGEGLPGDPDELVTGLATDPPGSRWAPPMGPQGPVSRGPKRPHGLRVAPDLARGRRPAALRALCTWVWALGRTRQVWGWSPSVAGGLGGRAPEPEIPSEYGVCLLTFDVQGS